MIKVFVETNDFGAAAHVGGSVLKEIKSFDIHAPELEAYLREYSDLADKGKAYWHRQVIGVECGKPVEVANA